jgi:hypothetical protein
VSVDLLARGAVHARARPRSFQDRKWPLCSSSDSKR